MKKYMVIYNPSSGKELAQQKIFYIAKKILATEDVEFNFYATKQKGDATKASTRACAANYDMIFSCGGDGTVHEVVNGIMSSDKKTKLAILPAGTVNDFAQQLGIPKDTSHFINLLKNENYKKVDLGKANDKYFVNVVGGGAFTNIPHTVHTDVKTILGKYAYYFYAALDIPGQLNNSYEIEYSFDNNSLKINTFLFLISNTSSVGGFKYLSPKAKFNDGLLDIIIIEKTTPSDLMLIFTSLIYGHHINHSKVHYFQSKNITINSEPSINLDLDGEFGGSTPITISSVNEAIEILAP